VDATNPTVFITFSDLGQLMSLSIPSHSNLELSSPSTLCISSGKYQSKGCGMYDGARSLYPRSPSDIIVRAISMARGAVHKAVPMTVGLCLRLGVAAKVEDTLPWMVALLGCAKGLGW
jgi:hypothetical protein